MSLDFLPPFQCRLGQVEQYLVVEGVFQPMILRDLAVPANIAPDLWLIEDR